MRDPNHVRELREALALGDLVEVIVQDEFTHDVIIHAPARYLVFDTT